MTSRRVRSALIGALYGVLSLFFCRPLLTPPQALGIFDWDQHLFYYGSVLKNVMEYARPPFWNPWYCGGDVLWQNPQVALLSPTYLFATVVSLPLAMKLNIVVHYWIALIGMHLLLRRIVGVSFLPLVVYLASLFTFCGALAYQLAVGHTQFLTAFYLPLLLFFFLRLLKTGAIRDAMLAAAVMALIIYNGGLHVLVMAVMTLGVFAVAAALVQRRWQPIALTVLVGAMAFLYAAPKLVPTLVFVRSDAFWDTRMATLRPDWLDATMFFREFVDPCQERNLRYGWYEYGNYVGPLGAFLIASSIIWIPLFQKRPASRIGIPIAATGAFLLVMAAGDFGPWSPAALVSHVPFFRDFRLPSRFTIACGLVGAVAVGWAARALSGDIVVSRRVKGFIAIVCALATLDLAVRNRGHLEDAFSLPPLEAGFHWLGGSGRLVTDATADPYGPNSTMLRALTDDRSVLKCYEDLQLKRSADAGQPLVFTEGASRIFRVGFSPNRLEFAVVGGAEPFRVFLNQNYDRGWRSDIGPVMRDATSGRPYVALAAGQAGKFSFSYTPPGLIAGVVLFACAVVVSVSLRRRAFGGDADGWPDVRT